MIYCNKTSVFLFCFLDNVLFNADHLSLVFFDLKIEHPRISCVIILFLESDFLCLVGAPPCPLCASSPERETIGQNRQPDTVFLYNITLHQRNLNQNCNVCWSYVLFRGTCHFLMMSRPASPPMPSRQPSRSSRHAPPAPPAPLVLPTPAHLQSNVCSHMYFGIEMYDLSECRPAPGNRDSGSHHHGNMFEIVAHSARNYENANANTLQFLK